MFSERGSASSRLTSMEVVHSTAKSDTEEDMEGKNRFFFNQSTDLSYLRAFFKDMLESVQTFGIRIVH